ncbi:hypothetical protein [Desulfotomaculum sp. 1211_IL3151]|uniref:hypothetical protein n=1 Tax=Desulfotomaculum sp. 1211_IL3151 TaxID=3084055 RepID=UPI002FD91F6D
MNSLILLFIFWVIISVLSGNKKKQRHLPPVEQETSTYRLPPDLRGKWGPRSEEIEHYELPVEEIREPQWVEPVIMDQKTNPPEMRQKVKPLVEKAASKKQLSSAPAQMEEDNFLEGNLTPAMVKNGIILSEILGPPVARRRGRSYQ